MDQYESTGIQRFKSNISLPFQLYNSLFTSLPFQKIEKTGILLSVFLEHCTDGYEQHRSPLEIIDTFFENHAIYQNTVEKLDLLFRFIQYVERQIVLFDALEDASFKKVNDLNGAGSLKFLVAEVTRKKLTKEITDKLKYYSVRIVLTAHPTQFYPGPVLGIINDLSKALKENNANSVNMYLQQLGKTAFFNKKKPTPYDEAVSLIWFLEHVFYSASGKMISFLKNSYPDAVPEDNRGICLGFWPGGDRDGNPNVNVSITLKVADALHSSILKCYYRDVKKLKRRLTFKGIEQILTNLEADLNKNILSSNDAYPISSNLILESLKKVKTIVHTDHDGLFESLVDDLINKVLLFGLYFASIDIRQDSSVHTSILADIAENASLLPKNYTSLSANEKINILSNVKTSADNVSYGEHTLETIQTIASIKRIQEKNGEAGCNRYIISQCNSALNIMEVYGLFLISNWQKESLSVDIIPLFENVEALEQSGNIMETVFTNEIYRQHLNQRNNIQTIMVGFSDGTKDGGYLMANWGIYKAKKILTELGRKYNIEIIFFDGRGGPPARGGGKTHNFYASMGKAVSNKEIQLTIQGQTISSRFGTVDAARYNMEQLFTAGIRNDIFPAENKSFTEQEGKLMEEISLVSMHKYLQLRNHPKLVDYLLHISPIKYYADTNIGSRPAKRNSAAAFQLKDLRAIPFVGAWSQIKQNVTGYYGVGTALEKIETSGNWAELVKLYKESLFFKTLIDNCEMSMMKSFFSLTAFLKNDDEYGEIWNDIYDEYQLSKKYVLKLSGNNELMQDFPVEQLSISIRDKIMLPLISIQQYALTQLRNMPKSDPDELKAVYEKMIIRCSFGIINGGRNSA